MQAKYALVKFTDMTAEMREEAMDICITAVEKYPTDMEKCTQVSRLVTNRRCANWLHNETIIKFSESSLITATCDVMMAFDLDADDQGSNGQEVWVPMARDSRQRICI